LKEAIQLVLSFAIFAAEWVFFAYDRPRALAKHPEREPRVDAVGIWALRALVFGPLALPFYGGRTRGWPGALAGAAVAAALFALSAL
jgi:hypothetical protein